MRPRLVTIFIIAIGVVTLSLFFAGPKLYKQELRSYFPDGNSLRNGADVRIAGISVGHVKSVKVRPELKPFPVEVVLQIQTPYELRIPQDAVATMATTGVLGETIVDIDIKDAVGPALGNHGTLRAAETPRMDSRKALYDVFKSAERDQQNPEQGNAAPSSKRARAPEGSATQQR